jgi:hypothetical protein
VDGRLIRSPGSVAFAMMVNRHSTGNTRGRNNFLQAPSDARGHATHCPDPSRREVRDGTPEVDNAGPGITAAGRSPNTLVRREPSPRSGAGRHSRAPSSGGLGCPAQPRIRSTRPAGPQGSTRRKRVTPGIPVALGPKRGRVPVTVQEGESPLQDHHPPPQARRLGAEAVFREGACACMAIRL